MASQKAAASDQTTLSRWRREYRLSLVLVTAGIVMAVVYVAVVSWANSTGNYPTSFGAVLAIQVTGTAGAMLILLAGTVAYYHRRGLQLIEGTA
ncbi:MAG: hypothetical protein WCB18_09525 [Thermoplasmata archaeon]